MTYDFVPTALYLPVQERDFTSSCRGMLVDAQGISANRAQVRMVAQ